MNDEETRYLQLLDNLMKTGTYRANKPGAGSFSQFGCQLRFSLDGGVLPVFTTKRMFFRGVFEELLFFIRGESDTASLRDKGIHIWDAHTSREYLDAHGLNHLPEWHMGKAYGFQWRRYSSRQAATSAFASKETTDGVDQLRRCITLIKNKPNSRKIILAAWNPEQVADAALAPCHCIAQFYVANGRLSCHWFQRSADAFLGLPFNIMSYALLTHLLAAATDLVPHEIIFSGGDVHLYECHMSAARTQLERAPRQFPRLRLNRPVHNLHDIETLRFEDVELVGYDSYPAIKAELVV